MKRSAATAAAVCMCAGALGANPAGAATFTNPASITIPDISGTATPYPSTISVSGLGTVTGDVNARLIGFNHTFPEDVDVLLVSPTGASVVLMSDVPGNPIFCNNDVTGVDLTFDDAAGPIPSGATLASGTYRPTNSAFVDPVECGQAPDPFVAPAPGGPYGSTLAVFNRTNPNGVWSLYVVDDAPFDSGSFASGWSLDVKPSNVFKPGATRRNKKKGTAKLAVNVPNPGELTGSGKGAKVASPSGRAVISKSVPAGPARLLIKAKGKRKKKLNKTGRVKLKVAITYTPMGGDPSTRSRKVTLKKI
jgi:subtilisin-like proprotein convertase family protein